MSESTLSDTMRRALDGATDEWDSIHWRVYGPTIEALKRRGLVETRLIKDADGYWHHQWRKVSKP